MTRKELKIHLQDKSLIDSIITIANDPTLQESKVDQIQALIFLKLTGEYWDECDDNTNI